MIKDSNYTALEIADYIVDKCIRDKRTITNLHLQKILFYTQVACAKNGFKAFNGAVEAWKLGPVVASVYNEYSPFGSLSIAWINGDRDIPKIDGERKRIIDSVVEKLRKINAWYLVELSHTGVWKDYFNEKYQYLSQEIPIESIAEDDSNPYINESEL